jgi:hypothetical protein
MITAKINSFIDSALFNQSFLESPQIPGEMTAACEICYEDFSYSPESRKWKRCCDLHFCNSCLFHQCLHQVTQHSMEQISCPNDVCDTTYAIETLYSIFTRDQIEEISYNTLKLYTKKAKDIRYCPEDGCSYFGIIREQVCRQKYKCPMCFYEWREAFNFSLFEKIQKRLWNLNETWN